MNTYLKQVSWKVVILLALISLTRPLLSIAGVFENIKPIGPILVTILIAIIWIVVAIRAKVTNPVITLGVAGALYAIFTFFLPILVALIFPEKHPEIPSLIDIIAVIVTNIVWGIVLGFIATRSVRQQPHG